MRSCSKSAAGTDYRSLPEDKRLTLLTEEITTPRLLSSPHLDYSAEVVSERAIAREAAQAGWYGFGVTVEAFRARHDKWQNPRFPTHAKIAYLYGKEDWLAACHAREPPGFGTREE